MKRLLYVLFLILPLIGCKDSSRTSEDDSNDSKPQAYRGNDQRGAVFFPGVAANPDVQAHVPQQPAQQNPSGFFGKKPVTQPWPNQPPLQVPNQPKGNANPNFPNPNPGNPNNPWIMQPPKNPNNGGVVNNIRGAAQRTVTQNELNNLRLFIDTASLATGEMPHPQAIYQAAVQSGDKKLAQAISDGAIILTGTRSREGIWAYEANAINAGGMVLKSDGIQRMTAAELRQALQNQ